MLTIRFPATRAASEALPNLLKQFLNFVAQRSGQQHSDWLPLARRRHHPTTAERHERDMSRAPYSTTESSLCYEVRRAPQIRGRPVAPHMSTFTSRKAKVKEKSALLRDTSKILPGRTGPVKAKRNEQTKKHKLQIRLSQASSVSEMEPKRLGTREILYTSARTSQAV
ncbi:hypothetical protein FGB62_325g012 [Gracilaria domingensis]|nr:hypothetical protein FGB62_325g012 [Gracilaria domingensis]